ncbi:hypothetical protein [Pendulispora albinea]|uniref:Uncharacterized protein n=1 Tax=Pendulispora albinea TaxID=2741071 RepID=A0ABZ2M782_9BACT
MADLDDKVRNFNGTRRADEIREGGLLGTWFGLSLGFAENVVRVSHSVFQDTVREVGERTRSTIAWAEGFPRGAFNVARSVFDAGDFLVRDGLSRIERGTLTAVSTFDRTGEDVRQVTGRAVVQVVGPARDGTIIQPS